MARVTVEDCLDKVDNRFELVLVATKRARQIAKGADPLLPWENDKPTVVALREIADNLVDASILDEVPEVEETEPVDIDAELRKEFQSQMEAVEQQAPATPPTPPTE